MGLLTENAEIEANLNKEKLKILRIKCVVVFVGSFLSLSNLHDLIQV